MPGFSIHIAVAKQYKNKYPNEIKDEKEFIKGTIAPDLNEEMDEISKDKSKTHYGVWGNYKVEVNIDRFLEDEKVKIQDDYWKGYFLHLLTDYYFYNVDFKEELEQIIQNQDKFYYDYDCINQFIIPEYKIEIIQNIKKYMDFIEGSPKYLKKDKIIEFIEKISSLDINEQTKIIQKYGMKGIK